MTLYTKRRRYTGQFQRPGEISRVAEQSAFGHTNEFFPFLPFGTLRDKTLIPDLNSLASLLPQSPSSGILCRRGHPGRWPAPIRRKPGFSPPEKRARRHRRDPHSRLRRSNTCQCLLRTAGVSALIDWFQLISVSAAHFKTGLTGRAGHRSLGVPARAPCALAPTRSILFNDLP